ncbi:uncharacterized protein N7469_004395 [Penicillium citrinum]|uniref:FHA domain-containing protein n=1 Tax=Penicillium citrinum TaxID=5077 RepID=A0A9W9P740_PENCI|nr:uncharacterized protein N7469_004395 [Penicillium citrinum]KAJ5235227.1 hypothetical protein N7469_004395 [Penicillium citrinum]
MSDSLIYARRPAIMADKRVTIELIPIDDWENFPSFRTLTLTRANPTITIGRSSKRKGPDRMPAINNGWFESRVMSREHAELSISQDQEAIYVRDVCSAHGTWLDGRKLITEEKALLVDGNTLRFGVDIDHGDESFLAMTFRCDIKWSTEPVLEALGASTPKLKPTIISHSENPSRPTSSRNTFCVPEDDSDMEEVPAVNTSFDDSNLDEDKDISTKPHNNIDLPGQFSVWDDSQLEAEHSMDQESEGEYVASDYSDEESELASSKSTSSHTSDSADVTGETVFSELHDKPSSVPPEGDSLKDENDEASCIDPSVLAQESIPEERYSGRSDNTSKVEKAPQPTSLAENPFSTRLPPPSDIYDMGYRAPFSSSTGPLGAAGSLYQQPCQQPCWDSTSSSYNRYRDGPFSWGCQSLQLPVAQPPASSASLAHYPVPKTHMSQNTASETTKDTVETAQEKDVSLASVNPGSKRKASEMESEDTIQDVQKNKPISSKSQEPELETISQPQLVSAISSALSEAKEDVKSEPPAKRVKPSPSPTKVLAGYTATAVISALLGGLGTIALLAALPAEYFQ